MTEKGSLKTQTSGTAPAAAFLRAFVAYDIRKEIRGNDYFAGIFLEEKQKKPLKNPILREWIMQNKMAPGTYEFMIARPAFFDRIAEKALKENAPQVVLPGAGYGSRPYRFREIVQDSKIFELSANSGKNGLLRSLFVPAAAQRFENSDQLGGYIAGALDQGVFGSM
jgi:O-methyltransferase involved in polyketide biosynthesis